MERTGKPNNLRKLPTGSVMSRFGPAKVCGYGEYAPLPPELERLMEQLAKLKYPINSKSELVKQLGGPAAPLFIGDMTVEAGAAVMFFPACIFPAATVENLAEKLAEVYNQRSQKPAVQKLPAKQLDLLAKKFMGENAKMVQDLAKVIQWVANEKKQTIEKDSEAFASRLLNDNYRLVTEIADAFYNVGRLRTKVAEESEAFASEAVITKTNQ